jgi:tetratricopeptide (TPR) repeat protein
MAIKVFISYSHDSPEHLERVWDLSERLRGDGIDCIIDQHVTWPEEGWPNWCKKRIEDSSFVLVVCTETYLQRYNGNEETGTGRGVKWEGFVITQSLYESEGKNKKFVPVLFVREHKQFIPIELRAYPKYIPNQDDGYYELLRTLTAQPERTPRAVADVIRKLPTREGKREEEKAAPQTATSSLPKKERKLDFSAAKWNVPIPQNPFFTGREEALKRVVQNLAAAGTAALSGMGGMGKSQVAAQYAYMHRSEYGAVLWANADTSATLASALAGMAAVLGLPEGEAREQDAALNATLQWLDTNDGWLLVLDNANDLPVIRNLVPRAKPKKHHILVTTQAQAVGALRGIPLDVMPRADATKLLLRRAKLIDGDLVPDSLDAKQKKHAEDIAMELDGLPLAIDQAGAYIDETGCGLQGYLDLYKQHSADLLEERGATASEHDSVARTFALSFEKVQRGNPAAAELLRLCAFLHPDAIPEEIITNGAAQLGTVLQPVAADSFALNKAIGEALKFSLLKRDADNRTLSIHRLVQVVVKDTMEEAQQREWAQRAVNAVNAALPYIEFANWSLCDRLIPHPQACASLTKDWNIKSGDAVRLLNQTGYYLMERARYVEAEPLYKDGLAIKEKMLGPNDPGVAASLNNLADLYRIEGRYAEAESLHRRALAVRETLGPEDPDVAESLNNLSALYVDQGRYSEAEPLYKRALAILEKTLGDEHENVASGLNNLGLLYSTQGKYTEAERLYERALTIREKVLGLEHPHVAASLNNLAELSRRQGKYAEALPLYQRANAIWEKTQGSEHPDLAKGLNNLAALYQDQGNYASAEPLYLRALAMKEDALGSDHPSVATTLENLTSLYREHKRDAEAEPLEARAKAIREKAR